MQERLKEHHKIALSKLDSERKKYTSIAELKKEEEEVQENKSLFTTISLLTIR
jgi:hypothetical protein